MKSSFPKFFFAAALTCGVAHAAPDESLASARAAYDARRYRDAFEQFSAAATASGGRADLCYNAGNAAYRMGEPGWAVLWYRRAWHAAPRDPDILANFKMAQNAGGAPESAERGVRALLLRLTRAEWTVIGLAAWWVTWLIAAVRLFRSSGSFPGRALMAIGAALSVIAGAGVWTWRGFDLRPEAVVVANGARALFAPLPESTIHFITPRGSIVHVREENGEWVKVEMDGREGWLPRGACERVRIPRAEIRTEAPDARRSPAEKETEPPGRRSGESPPSASPLPGT
jgi:hypothetical protein